MRKLKPMTLPTQRSTDPSTALMKLVNEGQPTLALREFLLRQFNLSPEQVDRMLRR